MATTDTTHMNRTDWGWLAGTYWYVPEPDVPALQYDPASNTLAWMIDQTVWHITGYRSGYFWGVASVALMAAADERLVRRVRPDPTGLAMIGSITPEGRIHLTFVPDAARTSRSATVGVGQVVRAGGEISLEMQMSSGTTDRTAHWAHMVQTRPGTPSFDALPGVGLSVPEMLQGIEPPVLETREPGS